MKGKYRAFLIPFAAGAVISAAVFFLGGTDGRRAAHLLCDAFFVAGVLVTGFGGLHFAGNQGLFDIISYSVRLVFHIHWPWTAPRTAAEGKESFADYKERKHTSRKSSAGTLLAGAVYLALAAVMLLVYELT